MDTKTSISKKHSTPIQKERKLRGWLQQKLAEELNTNLNTVSKWERGINTPSPYFREKLCSLFEKDAEQLGFIEATPQEALKENPQQELDNSTSFPHAPIDGQRNLLIRYLEQQRDYILNALAPGSTNTRVGDIIGINGFFIPPHWEMLQGTAVSTSLIEQLINALTANQRILLLGEAGQGKTTVLKHVFALMADRFIKTTDNAALLPLYVPLKEISSFVGNPIEILWSQVCDDFPLSFDDFSLLTRNNRIIFLFDGFDEIKGELTQQAINEHSASKIFTRPSILSCRKSFFDFYLSMSMLREYYNQWIELRPLELNTITQYIKAFFQQKQKYLIEKKLTPPEEILNFIRTSHELLDLAQRPLLLIMMLDVFTDPKEIHETGWTIIKLYRKYTEKWLKNEAAKPGSVLKWNEKAILLQELAKLTYSSKISNASSRGNLNQNITFTQSDLISLAKQITNKYSHITESQILDDLCFHTLLVVSEGEIYSFLHKSFQEYYVAKYIVECMRSREQDMAAINAVEEVFQEFLPWDVGTFLKGILISDEVSFYDKDRIVDMLIKVYERNKKNDFRSATIRQHASHYMALLGTRRANQFLEQAWKSEQDKWVQRGMMVGLSLYCDREDILEQYIKIIRSDKEAASINIGYYLVYYGDQDQELGYTDLGGENCDRTIQAIFRRLKKEKFRVGWVLDMLTLSTLLEQRGLKVLSSYQEQLLFLQEFLQRNHQNMSDVFLEEKNRLEKILRGKT